MNPKYFGLNATIGKVVKAPADQARIVAIAAAFAAAAQGQLPSSPVENVAGYYAQHVFPTVTEKLSEVNESVVFGAKSALDYTMIFWQMRYYAAFPGKFADVFEYRITASLDSSVVKTLDAMSLLCGGQMMLSEEMSMFMNKYKTEITLISAAMMTVLRYTAEDTSAPGPFNG